MSSVSSIAIVGASGLVGKSTLAALSGSTTASVTVISRSTEGASPDYFRSQGATVVEGSLDNVDSLKGPFAGKDVVYIIVPGTENRTALAANGIEAAKAVEPSPHVVVVSVATADLDSTIFGGQFKPIEDNVKASGLSYTLLRLPLFLDNWVYQGGSIKGDGKFYGPLGPDTKMSLGTGDDIGAASAAVLSKPAEHAGKTYNVTVGPFSQAEIAAALSKATGKTVEYVQLPFEAVGKSMTDMGMPEWQANGVLELYTAAEKGEAVFPSDVPAVLGRETQSLEAWVEANKSAFV